MLAGGQIAAEDMTDDVWDYIFLEGGLPMGSRVPEGVLKQMRQEFNYWYPFDMRVSSTFGLPGYHSLTASNAPHSSHSKACMWPCPEEPRSVKQIVWVHSATCCFAKQGCEAGHRAISYLPGC